MEFLNQAYSQTTDLLRSMTPATRITTVVLIVAIVVSAGFLFRQISPSPDAYLYGGRVLPDREIARLEAAFSKAGLNDWEATGNRIRVPHQKRFNYIAAAADEGVLPDDFDTILQETVKGSSPFESKELRDLRLKVALQVELAQIIKSMAGVEKATVKFHEERSTGFAREPRKTALVAALAEGDSLLTREQVESIRRTVANAIGAPPENVVVSDLRGPSYPGGSTDGLPSASDNVYAAHKDMFERHYREKIAAALAMIPGVIVGVNVELDPRMNQTSQTQTFNQPQAVRSSNTTRKSTVRGENGGGRVGAVPNGALGNRAEEVASSAANTGGSESTVNENSEESESVVGHETVNVVEAGLTPTNVTATIQIPQTYFRTIWLERNPPEPGKTSSPDPTELKKIETEEVQRIEQSVLNLLPRLAAGKDPFPRIYVRSFVDSKQPEPPEPGMGHQTLTWLTGNWRTLGLALLAMVGLWMVRSLARGAHAPSPPLAPPALPALVPAVAEAPQPAPEPATPKHNVLRAKAVGSGPNLRDELADIVKEDPDAAAAILSNWIGEAT